MRETLRNLSSRISTWMGLDRTWDTFKAKVCNSSFIILNQKSFCPKMFEIDALGKKCQNGNLVKNSHFAILALLSLYIDLKSFFCPSDFWLSVMKDLLQTFSQLRMNWIISSFPHRISKILFVLSSRDDSEGLVCRIGSKFFFKYF